MYIVSNIYVLYYELHNNAMPIKEKNVLSKYLSSSPLHVFTKKPIPNSKFSQMVGQFNQSCLSNRLFFFSHQNNLMAKVSFTHRCTFQKLNIPISIDISIKTHQSVCISTVFIIAINQMMK